MSTASPWAKAMFLYMYLFQYANHLDIMEEGHTKEPSHNNPEEAANYMKDVDTLLKMFVSNIHEFNPSHIKMHTKTSYTIYPSFFQN